MTLPAQDILAARILVVDDQDSNVHLLTRLLGEAGYTGVTSTTDPQAVSALHARNDYDLILLDLHMPIMDGFEVLAVLQTDPNNQWLPVIVLTAQPAHKLRALQAGARDFISKPFDVLEVTTRIRNMLEVRLLYRRLQEHNQLLERAVQERTAELRDSEDRYRRLTELASDWYWEQDENGHFTTVSGPVAAMLGVDGATPSDFDGGWNETERTTLRAAIAARRPFLDYVFSRTKPDGSLQQFRVSGEPMLGLGCRFTGYRGIGVEIPPTQQQRAINA